MAAMALRKHQALTANTVATVTLTGGGRAAHVIRVINRGATDVYFTTDNSAPVIDADDTYVVGAGAERLAQATDYDNSLPIKLISSGTPAVTVEVAERFPDGV